MILWAIISASSIAIIGLLYYLWKYHFWGPEVSLTHPRILFYHMISEWKPGMKFKGLRVSPGDFEQQIHYLAENDWQFLTMSQLANHPGEKEKQVAITFDDGYLDNLTAALPILQKYNACATLYLVEDRHDRDWSVAKKAHHNSGELMREDKLNDDQVTTLLQSGCFELGGHTRTHCNLASTSSQDKIDEINGSRKRLSELFDCQLSSFAYPFGIYGHEDIDLVAQAGYLTAVTTQEGIDLDPDLYQLQRIKVSGKDSLSVFRRKLRYGKRGYRA